MREETLLLLASAVATSRLLSRELKLRSLNNFEHEMQSFLPSQDVKQLSTRAKQPETLCALQNM